MFIFQFVNSEPVFPCKEWDPELPTIIQPNLDFLAPEFALTMSCCRGSDMFSIGVLIHAIFNSGKALYECNNQLSMFRKYTEEVRITSVKYIQSYSTSLCQSQSNKLFCYERAKYLSYRAESKI